MTLRCLTLLLPLFLLTGCASKEDPRWIEARTPGKTRSEVHALIGLPRQATTRPSTGWNMTFIGDYDTQRAAALFERDKKIPVQFSEAYQSFRGFMNLGIYYHYFFYDQDERLIHYWRRLVD